LQKYFCYFKEKSLRAPLKISVIQLAPRRLGYSWFLSSIDGVATNATRIPLAGFGQKSRLRLAGSCQLAVSSIDGFANNGTEKSRKHVKTSQSRLCDYKKM
jgi:hypothetical protein